MLYGHLEIACEQKCNEWAKVLFLSPVPVIYLGFPAVLLLGVFCHAWRFLPVTLLCAACLHRSGCSQRLTLYVCQSLLRQVSGESRRLNQLTCFLPCGPPVRLTCAAISVWWCVCFDVCIEINPRAFVCSGSIRGHAKETLGGSKVCSMAFTS